MAAAFTDSSIQPQVMLADLYVVAFKVDMDLADQVWELWNAGVITDDLAAWAWGILAGLHTGTNNFNSELSSNVASTNDSGVHRESESGPWGSV